MTRPLAVIGVLLVGATAACTPPEDRPLQPHVQDSGPVGPVPPGLDEYYGQRLSWGPCADYAETSQDAAAFQDDTLECARVRVPLDYAQPDGQVLTFGLLRKPARDSDRRIGSLLVNPGGPGASGMSSAAGLATAIEGGELGDRFDLVGFDPRGIASSQPRVHCLSGPERDAERLDSDADTSAAGVEQTERENREYAVKCAQRSGRALLANMGSRDVARDMDVIRSVLGDRKLTYLGYSYGTRLGAEYAERFPRKVRAMVLDGAIDPGQSTVDAVVSQGAGFQRAFNEFAAWCAGQESCALGDDPARAVTRFQQLTRPLVEEPVAAGPERRLSYDDATTAAIQALYAPQLWGQLNNGLRQLADGNGQLLLTLADAYYGREPDGTYSTTTDAFESVRCVDDQRVQDPERLREADRRYRESAPFLDDGRPPSAARDVCAFWPVPVTGDSSQPEVDGLPPTLVISTTGDPATPYRAGVELASALHGRLLTYEGTQHTIFLQGDPCVDDAATEYLVRERLPARGTRCSG